jgi:anti-sigma factor RsiW
MTPKFSASNPNYPPNLSNLESSDTPEKAWQAASSSQLDSTEEDCFELLSAYLDGEVTPQERKQVQQWLDNDPEIKKIYLQLRQLHDGIGNLAAPVPNTSGEQISAKVFERIDRSQKRRRTCVWGGGAIAALCLAALSNLFSINSPSFRMVQSPELDSENQTLMVAVAINKPAVRIPKTAVAYPQR